MSLTPAQAVDVINEDLGILQSLTGRLQRNWRILRTKVLAAAKTIPAHIVSPANPAEVELERLRPHYFAAVKLIAINDPEFINRAGLSKLTNFMKGEIVPVVTTAPLAQTKLEGANVTFTVVAKGNNLSYQWKKAGSAISGKTAASLTITGVAVADGATYTCTITNSKGAVTTTGVVLTITLVAPAITAETATPVALTEGDTLTLSVTATGTAKTYQWKKGGVVIGGATAATYTKTSVTGDAGTYTCVVTNSGGTVTSTGIVVTVAALG